MHWKQPIATDILAKNGFDSFDCSVWCHIILHCRNEETPVMFMHGNKRINTTLKRGQMIFRVSQFAREHMIDRKKVKNSIGKLAKWYNEMHIEAKPYGLIISVVAYDDVIKMNNETDNDGTMKVQRTDSERSTSNKSVKNDKIVKSGEITRALLLCQFLLKEMRNNNPTVKNPNRKQWEPDMEELLADGRTPEQLEALIKWAQQDKFWKQVILSPAAIKKHWDKLYLAMAEGYQKHKSNKIPDFSFNPDDL